MITPVDEIKKNVENKNNRVTKNNNKLHNILESRKKNRENWPEEKKNNYLAFLDRLQKGNQNYIEAFKKKIEECAESVLKKNINTKSFKLWDPQNIECDLNGFSAYTIYRGFWNSEKKKHDRLPHMEAGIPTTPFKQVSNELLPLGYKLEDLSDTKKSTHIVIKVSFIPKIEENNQDDNESINSDDDTVEA